MMRFTEKYDEIMKVDGETRKFRNRLANSIVRELRDLRGQRTTFLKSFIVP